RSSERPGRRRRTENRAMSVCRLAPVLALPFAILSGCGGSSSSSGFPTIQAARTYELVDFAPAAAAPAGQPTRVSFVIRQPDGKPLTRFRRGPGPHTGVHVTLVRDDLAYIVHRHPPIAADGTI